MKSELGAIAVAGTVMGAAILGAVTDAKAAPPREVVAAKFALEIGGIKAGWIQSIEGGHATSDVVTEKLGADHVVHKHIAGVKYEDITVNCGTGMSKAFYEWIKASFDRRHARVDGAIHSADYDGNIVSTMDFFHGLLTEVGFPALDAASKDGAKMTLKFAPELTRHKKGSGKVDVAAHTLGKGEQKKWQPAGFRFDYAGCGEPCKEAVRLSNVYVKLGAPPATGQTAAPLRTSNIVVTMPPPQDLMRWAADASVRDGTLEYLMGDGSVYVAFRLSKIKPVRVTVHAQGNKPLVDIELQPQSIEAKP